MTETRPAPPAPAESLAMAAPADPPGLAGWLSTSDHRRIGRLWITASLISLVIGGLAGAVLGVERADDGLSVLDADVFGQVLSLHAEVAVLLFLVPLLLGIATFVVPLQVGSPAIAFPRGAATAFWIHLVSAGLLLGAYAADGGPTGTDAVAVDLWLLALGGLVVAAGIALVSLLTTVLALRAPGLTLAGTPAFSWAILVGGGLTLLTSPVLLARLIVLFTTHHFSDEMAGYGNVNWFWSVPQAYLLVVPAAGIALEVVPVLARNRLRHHGSALVVLGLLGIVGIGAWAQVPATYDDVLFVALGLAAVLPALALLGLLGDTLRRGRPRLAAPLVLALASVVLLVLGAIAGALHAIEPLDLHGTVWEAGQIHLVLLGAGTLGGLAGLWWWGPKIWGAELASGAGLAVALAVFVGTLALAGPDLVNGLVDDVGLGTTEHGDDGVTALNIVSAAGGILVTVGALLAILAVLAAGRRGRGAVATDPWGGTTLEWTPGGEVR